MVPKLTEGAKKALRIGGLVLLAIFLVYNSTYSLEEGNRGVVLHLGKAVDTVEPGAGLKIPFYTTIVPVSTREQLVVAEKIEAYSSDRQPATMRVSVVYRVEPNQVLALYSRYKTVDIAGRVAVHGEIPTAMETVFGGFSAEQTVKQREELGIKYRNELVNVLKKQPVNLTAVRVENIDFTDDYEQAIAARTNAEVAVATKRQDKEREEIEKDITITKASAIAESDKKKADAAAYAIRVTAEAELTAMKNRSLELRSNPALLEWQRITTWNGVLPTTIMGDTAIPFMSVDKSAAR